MNWMVTLCLLGLAFGDIKTQHHLTRVPRKSFVQVQPSEKGRHHEVIFAVEQRNLEEFDQDLQRRSTPGSPLYQQWLSFDEVGTLTSNPDGAAAIQQWLAANDIAVKWTSAHKTYIKAEAMISRWEELFKTKFYEFEDRAVQSTETIDASGILSTGTGSQSKFPRIDRSDTCTIPEELRPHVSTIFNTVQTPPVLQRSARRRDVSDDGEARQKSNSGSELPVAALSIPSPAQRLRQPKKAPEIAASMVTISFLTSLYQLPTVPPPAVQTQDGLRSPQQQHQQQHQQQQAVFETSGESFSPRDLQLFQQHNQLPRQAALAPFGYSTRNCQKHDCYEGNLDVQFIMGVSPGTETVYWYRNGADPFLEWIVDVADTPHPPLVHTISWGSIEQVFYTAFFIFCYTAISVSVLLLYVYFSSSYFFF
jgi:hypothetical protein